MCVQLALDRFQSQNAHQLAKEGAMLVVWRIKTEDVGLETKKP